MRHLIPWGTNEVHQFFWSNNEASVSWFLQIKTTCLIISSDKNEAPHYFFRKKWSTSLFLQKKWSSSWSHQTKMKLLIISKKKHWFFSEEIKRSFIFFWRNNEALDFFMEEITLAGLLR
jgi:hypothetical protein